MIPYLITTAALFLLFAVAGYLVYLDPSPLRKTPTEKENRQLAVKLCTFSSLLFCWASYLLAAIIQ
jgi:hypothetical protein